MNNQNYKNSMNRIENGHNTPVFSDFCAIAEASNLAQVVFVSFERFLTKGLYKKS